MKNTIELEAALYIVPTPIGNLEDITIRGLKTLGSADVIACEDTRRTGQMLKAYKIAPKKLISYHEHNEVEKAVYLVQEIRSGKSVAVVSDAGAPGISDPGYRVIVEAAKNDIKIISLPGPNAFVPAIVASGFALNKFIFLGFPPQKKGRASFLQKAVDYDCPAAFYESPHRIVKIIKELIELCGGERKACFSREISKIYEEYFRGTLNECLEYFTQKDSIKGEFVVVLDRK